MDAKEAKRIVDYVFKDIFGTDNPYTLEQSMALYAYDIPLPHKMKSNISSGQETWGDFPEGAKVTSQADLIMKSAKDEFMRPKKPINSMNDITKMWDEINIYTGERYMDTKEAAESDGLYSSYGVYRSLLQKSSQYVVFCYNNLNCKYLVGSRDSGGSANSIRLDNSANSSSCYEVVWCKKVSRCFYVNNCYDMFECMFCNNISSKKYCIGNMQFEKEEYMKIKDMVIKWIMDDLKKKAGKG